MLLKNKNWSVYTAARRMDKMKPLEEKGAYLLKMDVTIPEEVAKGVNEILNRESKIDVLLANAGYGADGTIESVSIEEAQSQFGVNVFGAVRVIQEVLPVMRKQHG